MSNADPAASVDVVVVGAGLAGLRVADRLATPGLDVHVFEACDRSGGRVRASAAGHDLGAAFVGPQPHRIRGLAADLGVTTRPSGLRRGPVRWAVPGRAHTTWLPPHTLEMAATAGRLQRHARGLDPQRPWASARSAELDGRSFAEFPARTTTSASVRHLWSSLIAGFATVPPRDLSLLQVTWWVRRAGGVTAALRSGSELVVDGGAHQLPSRLAARLPPPVDTSRPVRTIRRRGTTVEVDTSHHTACARHVVVAVPLPSLTDIQFDPPLPAPTMTATTHMAFDHATKIVARITGPTPRHRTSIGDPVLPVAWRIGTAAAAMCPTPTPAREDLFAALARTLEVPPSALGDIETFAWHHPRASPPTWKAPSKPPTPSRTASSPWSPTLSVRRRVHPQRLHVAPRNTYAPR